MNKSIMTLLLIGATLFSCNSKETTGGKKDVLVVIHTSFGDMTAILYDETPLHKANFIKLAKEGQYDSTIFHRVIKDFMIQGGDIDAKNGTRNTETVPAEFVDKFYHTKGSLSAARQGDNVNPQKGSSWCQFYIVQGKKFSKEELTIDQEKLNQAIPKLLQYESQKDLKEQFMKLQAERDFEAMNQLALANVELCEREMNINLKLEISPERLELYTTIGGAPFLDTEYTVFGKVVEGLDIIDKIADQKTARGDKPLQDIHLTVELVEMRKSKITKLYGYNYPKK
jgi:peptidyl-prolyl cis-trans isomerase B (cyclophilin B)